jgi:hypothetical protein
MIGATGLRLPRRALLLLPLFAASCASDEPPRSFPPLTYEYLTPLPLNVGSIEIDDQWKPLSRADLSVASPVRPKDALTQMAQDRLKVGGSTGRAVFTIDDAALVQNGDAIFGSFAVHLDIFNADATRTGYAEARVQRNRIGLGRPSSLPGLLYDFTKQMMDAMNVEFEYQVKRSLQPFLVKPSNQAPVPAPVEQQPLAPPS